MLTFKKWLTLSINEMKCVIIAYETTITHLSLITYFFLTFLNFIFWGRGTYCQTAFFEKWRRKKTVNPNPKVDKNILPTFHKILHKKWYWISQYLFVSIAFGEEMKMHPMWRRVTLSLFLLLNPACLVEKLHIH